MQLSDAALEDPALVDPPSPPPDGPCNIAGGEVCPVDTVCSETDPAATGAECVRAPLSPLPQNAAVRATLQRERVHPGTDLCP